MTSRKLMLFNNDLLISKAHITDSSDIFYRNAHFDELFYIQGGSGNLLTNFGLLKYEKGDYIIIPKGVIYKMDVSEKNSCINC